MDKKWDLSDLYSSFDDMTFINDINRIKEIYDLLDKYPTLERNVEHLKEYLRLSNELSDLINKLLSYTSLILSADTSDHDALKYDDMIENIIASHSDINAKLNKWICGYDLDSIDDEYIHEHKFYLNEIKENSKYLLDDASEKVLASMKTTGSSAWAKYKDSLISNMKVTIDDHIYSLTEVLNMAYSKDANVRKKAYEAEIASYKQVESGVASCLNAIKGEAITIVNLRGYESVLDRTLKDSRMSKKTLDVLLDTMKEALPLFERYYQLKAKMLGYEGGLKWYDLYAPVIEIDMSYPYDKGSEFVVKQFSTFSDNLGAYAKHAIDHHWIDVYPRTGKVGGAFCNNLHCIKQSRFLLNYGDDFSGVVTMAHELGHGFHGHCLDSQYALNSDYPMPIAETASNFCETIVKKAALKEANKAEQIMILDNEIGDCAQTIVDIYSRYLFESRFITKRKQGPLSVEEIKDLMIQAQKEAYLNGLNHDYLHPYMWTWKPHYYYVDYAYYNFPYAFGLLLAKALYGLYIKEGPSFSKTYEKLLSITGKMSLEDIGKVVDIDLTSKEFWNHSINMIKEDIDLFEKLIAD